MRNAKQVNDLKSIAFTKSCKQEAVVDSKNKFQSRPTVIQVNYLYGYSMFKKIVYCVVLKLLDNLFPDSIKSIIGSAAWPLPFANCEHSRLQFNRRKARVARLMVSVLVSGFAVLVRALAGNWG